MTPDSLKHFICFSHNKLYHLKHFISVNVNQIVTKRPDLCGLIGESRIFYYKFRYKNIDALFLVSQDFHRDTSKYGSKIPYPIKSANKHVIPTVF